MTLTLLSWNVNGIRSLERQKKSTDESLFPVDADVVCVQETKVNDRQHIVQIPGYLAFYAMPTRRKKIAYSGVATFIKPIYQVERVFKDEELLPSPLAGEGRCLILEMSKCLIANVYFVNDNEERRAYRVEFFYAVMRKIKELASQKLLILCGDLNAVPYPRDHCLFYQSNISESFNSEDPLREVFKSLIEEKVFIDCYRYVHPEKEEAYTCWNTKLGTRASNFGTRIDYILISKNSNDDTILNAQIMPHVLGSDHCPVFASFKVNLEEKVVVPPQKSTIMDFLSTNTIDPFNYDDMVGTTKKKPRITRITTFFMPTENDSIDDVKSISDNLTSTSDSKNRTTCASCTPDDNVNWENIFKKKRTVLCKGHGEPCKLLQVQKKGLNYKRFFYICPRPIGNGKDFRCDHFEWLRN